MATKKQQNKNKIVIIKKHNSKCKNTTKSNTQENIKQQNNPRHNKIKYKIKQQNKITIKSNIQ